MADQNHPRLLLFALLLILLGSAGGVAISEKTDARIIQVTHSDGSVWVNPDANVGVQNIECASMYSFNKQMCDIFCGAEAKAMYAAEWNYHDYMYGHYDVRNYPQIWQTYNPNTLMNYNLKRSKFYKERYAACKLCSGLGDVKPVWVMG